MTSLLNLWPVADGPDVLNANGTPSGIAENFANPLQTIREDFGTARVDHIFSDKDSLGVVYTVDDSADQTATAINPFMADATSLREQVAEHRRNACLLAHAPQHRACWFLPRELFLYRGAYTRHTGGHGLPVS